MQLGSGVDVAVAQAGSCSSNLTPSLGTSICLRCGHKKKKKILAQRRPNIKPDLKGDISTLILVYTYATRGCPFIEETTWLQPDPLPTPNRVSWDGVTDSLFCRLKVHFWVHMGFFLGGRGLFKAIPMAYESSQATGGSGAAAANLYHSHSCTGSEPHLQPTPQLVTTPDSQPTERRQGWNLHPHGYQSGLLLLSRNRNSWVHISNLKTTSWNGIN